MASRHSTRSPAFQFYPGDFLRDGKQAAMSLQECGAYIRLICFCWTEGCIPDDVTRAARMVGTTPAVMRKLWPAVRACFKDGRASGELIHSRLEAERKKQADYRRRQSDKGKASAASRRATDAQPNVNHGSTTVQPDTQPKPNSSIFSLRSSSSDFSRTKTSAREPDDVSLRAGTFVNETYPALYAKHRKGARYISRPALDFQEALQLCRVWSDERLEKLAIVFLTTDHEFAEKGSRTIAQFRSMASWCDSRLAEAGIA